MNAHPVLDDVTAEGAPGGGFSGTTQVGDHHHAYTCADARLTRLERAD